MCEWASEPKRSCARVQPNSRFGHPSFIHAAKNSNIFIYIIWIVCTQTSKYFHHVPINVCNAILKLDWSKWKWVCSFCTLSMSELCWIKMENFQAFFEPVMCSFRWESLLRLLFCVDLFHFLRFKKIYTKKYCILQMGNMTCKQSLLLLQLFLIQNSTLFESRKAKIK